MLFGRSLLITFALLAYLGQSLAYAVPACEGMGDADTGAQHSVMADSEHMQHQMATVSQAEVEHGEDCCGSQCQCVEEGCHSPVPAIASSNTAQVISATGLTEQQSLRTISTSFYLYKPPILS